MNDIIEALGFDGKDRLLIIHADDVGMCHSVNEATFSALSYEIVTCGSLMIPCPWVLEAAELTKKYGFDAGVHVTLNSEWEHYKWPPISSDGHSTLVDEYGYLWRSVEEAVAHAVPSEVEKEVEAQVIRAFKMGIEPSHIDTHMGTVYAKPEFFMAYVRIADKHRIPPMLVKPSEEMIIRARKMGLEIESLKKAIVESHWPKLDMLMAGIPGVTLDDKRRALRQFLRGVKGGMVVQVIVHLGLDTPELRAIMPRSYPSRVNEYKLVTDNETRKLIEELGFQLIGWREIKKAIMR